MMPTPLQVIIFTSPLWGGFLLAFINFIKK